MLEAIVLVVFPFCMAFSAMTDTLSMKISNRVPLVLVAAFLVVAPLTGMPLADIGLHLLAGFAALVPLFVLFAVAQMGAGDAKLIAATMVWMGFTPAAFEYVIFVSLFGGALAVAMLMYRKSHWHEATSQNMFLRNFSKDQDSKGIPYGVALGAAGLLTYPSSPLCIWALERLTG